MDISKGYRDDSFKTFISKILRYGISDESFIESMLSKKGLYLYDIALTSKDANNINNYEMFEQLGDVSINKFVVNYMYGRFPQLENPNGVDLIARLKIKYASKEILHQLGEEMGMWPFITATKDEKHNKRKILLEDTFESFFGVTEYIIDTIFYTKNWEKNTQHTLIFPHNTYIGIGFNMIFGILKYLFDTLDISLNYESLVDSKTRLNELALEHKMKIVYEQKSSPGTKRFIIQVINKTNNDILGIGTGSLKRDAEINAATNALETLKNKYNIIKQIPQRYKTFY
jgi:dsRNA-specific ribonuclease